MIAALLLLLALCSVQAAEFYMTSSASRDCSGDTIVKIALQTNTCLNNHDFSQVACDKLNSCIAQGTSASGRLAYEDLVACSGAPAMHLSSRGSISQDGCGRVLRGRPAVACSR